MRQVNANIRRRIFMSIPHNVRASDRSDLLSSQREDFVARKRDVTLKKIYNICLAALITVLGVAILVYNNTLLGSMMCVIVGSITLSLGRQIEKQQKVLHATEFMNALFASVIGSGSLFCMVVRADGEIMYLNRGTQDMFPTFLDQPVRHLDLLLSMHNVPEEHRGKIAALIAQQNAEKIGVTIEDGEKKSRAITLSIEPILRPKGFTLIRGLA